jgi:hypothetical protein
MHATLLQDQQTLKNYANRTHTHTHTHTQSTSKQKRWRKRSENSYTTFTQQHTTASVKKVAGHHYTQNGSMVFPSSILLAINAQQMSSSTKPTNGIGYIFLNLPYTENHAPFITPVVVKLKTMVKK